MRRRWGRCARYAARTWRPFLSPLPPRSQPTSPAFPSSSSRPCYTYQWAAHTYRHLLVVVVVVVVVVVLTLTLLGPQSRFGDKLLEI